MSLIYEALRKLEREKRVPGTGFTVVARSTWPERRTTWLPLVLGGVALLASGLFLGRWLTTPPPANEAVARPAAVPPPARAPLPVETPGAPLRARPAALPATQVLRVVEPAIVPEPAAGEGAPVDVAPPAGSQSFDEGPPPPLVLEAIAVREGVQVAIISGQLVRAGDRVGEALVVRIGPDDVELEVAGERRLLGF